MKNGEKFREEIREGLATGAPCSFVRDVVIPRFVGDDVMEDDICGGVGCTLCSLMFAFWLDEEYEEPPKPEVDWSKVPVDTLVRVRDYENREWCLRYFKGINKSNSGGKYEVWSNGMTSKTASDSSNTWKYCELVEDEDDK